MGFVVGLLCDKPQHHCTGVEFELRGEREAERLVIVMGSQRAEVGVGWYYTGLLVFRAVEPTSNPSLSFYIYFHTAFIARYCHVLRPFLPLLSTPASFVETCD